MLDGSDLPSSLKARPASPNSRTILFFDSKMNDMKPLGALRETAAELVRATEATLEGITILNEKEAVQKRLLEEGATAGSKLFDDLKCGSSVFVSLEA